MVIKRYSHKFTHVRKRIAPHKLSRYRAAGFLQSASERIVRRCHAIDLECGSKTALVKSLVMRHKHGIVPITRNAEMLEHRHPHSVKCGSIACVLGKYSVNLFRKMPYVPFRFRLYKLIEPIGNNTVDNLYSPDGTNARRLIVGRFYIDGNEIINSFTRSFTVSMSHRGVEVAPHIPIDSMPSSHWASISSGLVMA